MPSPGFILSPASILPRSLSRPRTVKIFELLDKFGRWLLTRWTDGIDLEALPFAQAAFRSIEEIKEAAKNKTRFDFRNASRIDVHVHAVPSFYYDLVPSTAGVPTPEWSVHEHLQFMADNGEFFTGKL